MNLNKSIEFLLENAGAVIQYRLRKEILHNLSKTEEENLLEQIYQTPYFRLVQSYVKPNGYIGSGMHSFNNWRGVRLHETPLQDGETAARLLSYYAIPKVNPIVANFIAAMRNEETLRHEFSYIPPEIVRYEDRLLGMSSGFCLMILLCAMQAMLSYGDDREMDEVCKVSFEAFKSILQLHSFSDITKTPKGKSKYDYPYVEEDTYCPSIYHLAILAYTNNWRTAESVQLLADALNHRNAILPENNDMRVKIRSNYYSVGLLHRPIHPFRADTIHSILYRRALTEIAMLGVGERVEVIRESVANLREAIGSDGILRMRFDLSHNKRYSPKAIDYPTPYVDVRLEPDYSRKYALECDLTFWAVQFLYLVQGKI
ncbi:MAG: hypothetical protein FWF10_00710 [Clostridiales bacterium]|nr:hypothetical protein [Clostridiales bacterium]